MKSRIPSDKILETYTSIAKDIVDPSTKFIVKNVDGKTRIITEKSMANSGTVHEKVHEKL